MNKKKNKEEERRESKQVLLAMAVAMIMGCFLIGFSDLSTGAIMIISLLTYSYTHISFLLYDIKGDLK